MGLLPLTQRHMAFPLYGVGMFLLQYQWKDLMISLSLNLVFIFDVNLPSTSLEHNICLVSVC